LRMGTVTQIEDLDGSSSDQCRCRLRLTENTTLWCFPGARRPPVIQRKRHWRLRPFGRNEFVKSEVIQKENEKTYCILK